MKADDYINPNREFLSRDAWNGLTVRDHIAIEAMNGLLSNKHVINLSDMQQIAEKTKGGKFIVEASFNLADKMIEQSNK